MSNKVQTINTEIYNSIKSLMDNARKNVAKYVNNVLVKTYWEIGKIIIEEEQKSSNRAEYGRQLLIELSKKLSKEYGKGLKKNLKFK